MNRFFVLIFLLTSTLVSAISIELVNGRIIEAKLIKVIEKKIYLEMDQNLIIIDKKIIVSPKKYTNSSFTENEKYKINFNSFIIIDINSAENLDLEINSKTKHNIKSKNNFAYVELLGSGILYSINFERRFYKSYSVRVGATSWKVNDEMFGSAIVATIFPVALLKTFGKGPGKFELGGGVSFLKVSNYSSFTFIHNINSEQSLIGNASAIFRFEPSPFPLIFKIGCTSLIMKDDFKLWPSVCAGFAF